MKQPLLTFLQSRNSRRRAEVRNAALSKLGERLNRALTSIEAARSLGEVSDELFRWDAFTLNLIVGDERIQPIYNVDTIGGKHLEIPPQDMSTKITGQTRRIIKSGGELILRKEPLQFDPEGERFGNKNRPSASLMYVPIRNGTQVIGLLSVQSYRRNAFNREDLATLQTLADYCGVALERVRAEAALREMPGRILHAQESERMRVARELHDSVNQILSSTKFRLDSIEPKELIPDATAVEHLTNARALLEKAMHEVWRISRNLRPSELDDLGLMPAVRSLCSEFIQRTGVNVELHLPKTVQLSPTVELTVYRIIQEALNNVEKHSEATNVGLTLSETDTDVRLHIEDNGIGLKSIASASTNPRKKSGMGLAGMKERITYIGGVVDFKSVPDAGMRIEVRIPRPGPENGAASTKSGEPETKT